jgi:hypothetical protein
MRTIFINTLINDLFTVSQNQFEKTQAIPRSANQTAAWTPFINRKQPSIMFFHSLYYKK